jgi:sortase (surface protein transpeptidase)
MSTEAPDRGTPAPRRRRTSWWVTATLGLVGALLVVVALQGLVSRHSEDAPSARQQVGGAQAPPPAPSSATAPRTRSEAPRVLPSRLRIPAIGVSQDLLRLGLNADRTVEVPTSAQADLPGWYELGPTPGQTGSAVVLGHVDSVRGPAVFHRLRELSRGDRVEVQLRNGTVANFAVQRVATYPNAEFPAKKVYASHGYAGLQLVTCGGDYDPETGYTANVVVYTRLVGTTD